jgi:hypothetical protein
MQPRQVIQLSRCCCRVTPPYHLLFGAVPTFKTSIVPRQLNPLPDHSPPHRATPIDGSGDHVHLPRSQPTSFRPHVVLSPKSSEGSRSPPAQRSPGELLVSRLTVTTRPTRLPPLRAARDTPSDSGVAAPSRATSDTSMRAEYLVDEEELESADAEVQHHALRVCPRWAGQPLLLWLLTHHPMPWLRSSTPDLLTILFRRRIYHGPPTSSLSSRLALA